MSETGLLTAEAVTDGLLATTALKAITGRQRPDAGNGRASFFKAGDSFLSDHAVASWAAASVIAHEYPGPLTKFLAYGAAATVSASRVTARKHFASDVLIGSALGWYLGRQVVAAHRQQPELDEKWGSFEHAPSDEGGRPKDVASIYVPLDSWVYPAFDRLTALGYVQTGFVGLRPWTRIECARLISESADLGIEDEQRLSEAAKLYRALATEFAPELRMQTGEPNTGAYIESIYTRVTGIGGTPVRDGYHFAQTLTNDFGRPYGEGANTYAGVAASAVAGPVAFYVRGEYQHAGQGPELPAAAQHAIAQVDGVPAAPASPAAGLSSVRLLDAYATLNVRNTQVSFGNQSLWWGPGQSGPLLFSDNAQPVTMLRFDRVSPFKLPSVLGFLGPARTDFFIGRLSGHQFVRTQNGSVGQAGLSVDPQPYIHGQKISFKPTPNLEFSVSRTVVFGGPAFSVTLKSFWRSATSGSTSNAATDPGDRRAAFDFNYRVPGVRDWLVVYADTFSDDQPFPLAYPTQSAWSPGVYLPKLPRLPKLDFRAEGILTPRRDLFPGFFYFNVRYRNGYTNDRQLIGDWIGRQGSGVKLWSTYWLSPRSTLQLSYRGQWVDHDFLLGGSVKDIASRADLAMGRDLSLGLSFQYERWNFPLLSFRTENNATATLQLTYSPRWKIK